MQRVTVRIIGLLLLVFGLALWRAKVIRPPAPVPVRPPTTLAPKASAKHKAPRPPTPVVTVVKKTSPFMRLPAWNPTPFIASGALLFFVSFFLPKSKPKALALVAIQKGTGMSLPEKWDERQISLDIGRYRGDQGLLGKYIGGIMTRFVAGQDARTVEARLKFLQTFNKYSEVARESYRWQRYLQGGRATLEEDLEDINAQIKLAKAKNELEEVDGDQELAALQKEATRLAVMVEIARRKKEIADINKPDPPPPLPPPPPPPRPSAAELRDKEKADLDASEKLVREQMRLVALDPTLSEEQKRRKLNALEERLAEIHEKQVQLL